MYKLATDRRIKMGSLFTGILLAALCLSLLFILNSGLVRAQSADQFFTYAENGTGPVASFTVSDPEGATPGYWSLVPFDATFNDIEGVDEADAADENLFKIDQSGVLSFKTPRSYEDNSASGDKEYRVTVQVSDGSVVEYFEAYVEVTDVEETGKVTWTVAPSGTANADNDIRLQQFQPGALLTAAVTDPDGTTSSISYKWYRGSTAISGKTAATYTVVSADVGNRIRVDATYSDGSGPAETVSSTSENPVQAFRRETDNEPPVFSPTDVTRRVEENSKGNVGGSVTATDGNSDKLTYTLAAGGDNVSFKIDPATGQLMVGNNTLDYETKDSYEVTVTATDSSGVATGTAATVTINVIDVDEKPVFDADDSTGAGVVPAQTEGRTVIDTDDNPADASSTDPAIFVASDPEGEKVTLSLMGSDAGSFELNNPETAATPPNYSKVLAFKDKPDFEMPGDRNRDNVYEVTVRASDGTMNADRALIIKVINNADEGGKVTVSPEEAVVGVELTASLAHMEGSVSASGQIAKLQWQWQRSTALNANQVCDATTQYTPISGATKVAYTPVSDDAGTCLRAMAMYNYQFAATAIPALSTGTEVLVSQANQAPKFKEGTSTFRVVAEDVRAVNGTDDDDAATDDDVVDDNVGSPIGATDANGDMVTYTLGGADAAMFRVRQDDPDTADMNEGGQIEVKGKLDHETNASLTVTLTANDGTGTSNDSATITVTIYVTDVDEKPAIKDRADSTAKGMRTVEYVENGTGPVARFTVSDPEGAAPIFWSLTAAVVDDSNVETTDIADRALFKIDQSGVLSFKTPRSFEDESVSGDDNYQVVVQASDGNNNGYFELTVEVTDLEETGAITWTVTLTNVAPIAGLQQFQPGAVLTSTVTDKDGDPTGITYKWYRGSTVISGQTANAYTVIAADVGSRIRVEATYSDGSGPVETVSFTSENPVQEAAQPGINTAPEFASTTVSRRVEENSKGNVGGPVAATDGNGDKLTYTLDEGTDARSFKIDPATGQLMVGNNTLDYETKDSYEVTVTATDSSGAPTAPPATVTINVIDVDEKPVFDADDSTGAGVVLAQTEGRTVIDTDDNPADASSTDPAIFVASDPEGEKVTLSLMGSDAGSFELNNPETAATPPNYSKVLAFKDKPDFEMPGDRNRDNVYEVTVRASDGTMNADRALIIKVINNADEGGKVTVSPEEAVVGVELTASLAHMEGSVSASGQIAKLQWQWQRSTALNANQVCDATTQYTPISGATKVAYTPVSDDAGTCLRAMAMYNYQFAATAIPALSTGTEVLVSQANQAPKFKEGTSTFRVVAEDVRAVNGTDDDDAATDDDVVDDNVGSPIGATDANGDMVTYTLGGADASLFRVRSDGQLEVKGKLDHEKNASHTVTLTANDGSGASNDSATITVTIYVTDVDEDPEITASGGGVAITGPARVSRDEGSTGTVATYTAAGATLRLSGADAGDFSFSNGALAFRSTPNYEAPTDANEDNVYMVTVTATATEGEMTTTRDVTVTVINKDEAGMVEAISGTARVDSVLTAGMVTDLDGSVSGERWTWERSMDGTTGWSAISGATSSTYTAVAGDVGYHLRVKVTYTDPQGSGKMATSAMTAEVVAADAGDPLVTRYAGDDGILQRGEVITAINDYLDAGAGAPSRADVITIINLYLDS